MKFKKYISIFENRRLEYKAWFNSSTNWFYQFSTNGIHNEIAKNELHMNEVVALKKGYYRIFVGYEVIIDSYKQPDDREFNATKYIIEKNSYKKFKGTRWFVTLQKGDWFFPNQSFLFADTIKDGKFEKY